MLKIYPFLVALSALLLSGCGRERASREAASSAGAPVAADTVGRPAPQPAAAATSAPADTTAPARANPTAAEPALVAGRQPAPRIRRGATVLADVPDEPADSAAAATNAAENTAELRRFLEAGLPAPQTFAIRPGRDTLVTGPQGTQLLVPARAWALPDSTAVVQLTLREFYTMADMVLAGLSTTSGPQLLETGGMLHISATANGLPVALRPGAFVHLRMPAKEKKPGMQLFEGALTGPDQALDWQLPQPPAPSRDGALGTLDSPLGKLWGVRTNARHNGHRLRHRRVRDRTHSSWPDYEGGDKQLLKDLGLLIDYADATRTRLRRTRRITRAENNKLIDASKQAKQRILRIVQVKFVLDTTGVVSQAQAETDDATTDKQLNKDVLAAIAQLNGWNEPAVQREYPSTQARKLVAVDAARYLTVLFPEKGPVVVKMGKWGNETRRLAELSREQQRLFAVQKQHATDSVYRARRPYYDSLAAVGWRLARERAAAELARIKGQFTDTARTNISEAGVYEEFSAQKLAWINADRFSSAAPLLTLGVNPGQPGAVVKIIFRKMRGVINGQQYAPDKLLFNGVPRAAAVTLVALRRENGITYLATRDVKAEALLYAGLVYRPVTMAELRAELARLD